MTHFQLSTEQQEYITNVRASLPEKTEESPKNWRGEFDELIDGLTRLASHEGTQFSDALKCGALKRLDILLSQAGISEADLKAQQIADYFPVQARNTGLQKIIELKGRGMKPGQIMRGDTPTTDNPKSGMSIS